MIDPWRKVVECDRAINNCIDPERKPILINLRELWIAIADEKAKGLPDWHDQAKSVDQLHADILNSQRRDSGAERYPTPDRRT
jgi:hypothetical protein